MVDNGVKKLYVYDSVYRIDYERNRFVYGVVNRCFRDEDAKKLERGQVEVFWNYDSDKSEICDQSEVHLMSRYITAGKIVRRIENESETQQQQGLCLETKQITTVKIRRGTTLNHVDRNRFYRECPIEIGDAVSCNDNVGRIMSVNRLLYMRSIKDNAEVIVRSDINKGQIMSCRWVHMDRKSKPNSLRKIIACVPEKLINPKWLRKTKCKNMEKLQQFIVESSEICSVEVCWLLPNGKIDIRDEDFKKLDVLHRPHDVLPGDCYMMKTEPVDVFINESKWSRRLTLLKAMVKSGRKQVRNMFKYDSVPMSLLTKPVSVEEKITSKRKSKKNNEVKEGKDKYDNDWTSMSDDSTHFEPVEERVRVVCLETKVTVLWQDGTEERDILSTELFECDPLDDRKFFPGNWVTLDKSDEDERVWGLVKSVDFVERTAKVQWSTHTFGCSCSKCKKSDNFNLIDEHSVHDLISHDKFIFDLDNTVYKSTTNGAKLGRITNIVPKNGSIVVQWSDGSTEYHLPGREELKLLPDLEDIKDRRSLKNNLVVKNKNKRTRIDNKEPEKQSYAVDDDVTLVDEGFYLLDETPKTHKFYNSKFEPQHMGKFVKAVQHEYKLLKESLPGDVWVHAYDDRIDLLSLMIRGAKNTPYEDGLFFFDIQLRADYPKNPPQVHFISYNNEQLNPNLYVQGKVCVSLLGTWQGQDTEVWTANSNLLQVIVSIQGLILVAEPYYNEPGYERDRYTQEGQENSRAYNEAAIVKVVKSMTEMLNTSCPKGFQSAVRLHFKKNGVKMCRRIVSYCNDESTEKPDYPLLPFSRGVKLSLNLHIKRFRKSLAKVCEISEPNEFSS